MGIFKEEGPLISIGRKLRLLLDRTVGEGGWSEREERDASFVVGSCSKEEPSFLETGGGSSSSSSARLVASGATVGT
jgi:hypothetical protein